MRNKAACSYIYFLSTHNPNNNMSQLAENLQLQEDEICALRSIYGEGVLQPTDENSFCVHIPEATGAHLSLRFHLPDTYPTSSLPIFELSCDCLPSATVAELSSQLESESSTGEPVLFNWIEVLKERWQALIPEPQPSPAELESNIVWAHNQTASEGQEELQLGIAQHKQGSHHATSQEGTTPFHGCELAIAELELAEVSGSIVHGEPLTEKRSTFQAHLAPVQSVEQVEAVMEVLLRNNKVRAATHNIMAFRIEQADKGGAFLQDCDDDGEAAAGGRLLHLLQMVDARNVVVVVSRWYGGILLGPARFTYINNAARQVLDACGYIDSNRAPGEAAGKGKGKRRGGGK